MKEITVFVSSPGDVSEERVLAERVVNLLAMQYHGVVTVLSLIHI